MQAFIATEDGQFTLEGNPWAYHGATYFGRRPGTCGADWMGEHWQFNAQFLERDFAHMHELGLNGVGLFLPGREFFDGLEPDPERFARLDYVLEQLADHGLRAVIYGARGIGAQDWCNAHGVEMGPELWHPAVNRHAEQHRIDAMLPFLERYAERPEIMGWAMGIGRFFRFKFTAPLVRSNWARWLEERFEGDFERAREVLRFEADERTWAEVRMPTEMEPYFNHENPRSYEFALMQQTLTRRSTARIVDALRQAAPRQLLFESMEGCCFSTGHLNTIVPEMTAADALWLEAYHWEGLRSYHILNEEELRWMPEPVANRPSVDVINAAGYVRMLTRWMQRSGKPIIICHGVDIGEKRRGVRSEKDQTLMLDRYNTFFLSSGGRDINYWCWLDDELSKTYTRELGFEYTRDTPQEEKEYSQAGETMGIVRYDGSERPVAGRIRGWSASLGRLQTVGERSEVLVLFPCPVFQSLYRYRANLTGFAILTSLARQGMDADVAMSSAGEKMITREELSRYRLVVIGASEYDWDHPEVPGVLCDYVNSGGALLFALGDGKRLKDPYLAWRDVPAMAELTGAGVSERVTLPSLRDIAGVHPGFITELTPDWQLRMDEEATLSKVCLPRSAELLVDAQPGPLLYRHRLGQGVVYAFTWNLDVVLYNGGCIDYAGGHWDWLWQGLARQLGLRQDMLNPMTQTVREMSTLRTD